MTLAELPSRLGWLLAAAVIGLVCSTVFSSLLQLERAWFVLAYGVLSGVFLLTWVGRGSVDLLSALRRRPLAGTLAGLVLSAVLAHGVKTQPASTVPDGWTLIAALAWFGLAYGLMDAMLLNVLPVLAAAWARQPVVRGALGFAGSVLVTAAYHVGFDEFRGQALLQPMLGNAIITTGYLMTGSPLTSIVAHVAMHGAAVLHGMETTMQLPPHYR